MYGYIKKKYCFYILSALQSVERRINLNSEVIEIRVD